MGGGLLIAGGGAFLYLDARGTIQDHNNATTYEAYAASASDADKAKSRQTMGVAAMAVAGGVILGGVLHYVFHTRPYAESAVTESAVTTTATVTRDGATFAITGTF